MKEICIKIPDELKIGLENTKLDVSKAVIQSVREELSRYIALKSIASKSKLDEEGATELGRHLKKSRSEKLKKEGTL